MQEGVVTRERVRRMSQPRMEPKSEGERMRGMCEKTGRSGQRTREKRKGPEGQEVATENHKLGTVKAGVRRNT